MHKIMLLEDDASLIDGLEYTLKKNDFDVDVACSLKEARRLLGETAYDLLLFDVTLPDGNGFSLCEELREGSNLVPVIFLTAADEEYSVIRGLDIGGDDYITKPFRLGELLSRIHALLRRSRASAPAEYSGSKSVSAGSISTSADVSSTKATSIANPSLLVSGDVTIDLLASRVFLCGEPLTLTAAEYRLLCMLVRNAGLVVTRRMILEALWDGAGHFVDDNTLSVYIRRLREKIEENPSAPRHLLTVRGFGYRWSDTADSESEESGATV